MDNKPPKGETPSAAAFRRDMAASDGEITDEMLAQFRSGSIDPVAEEHRLRQFFEVFPPAEKPED